MKPFVDVAELMSFARSFLDRRLTALAKDTAHCLTDPHAPFPAILLCFSTIDLLGAVSGGDAKKYRKNTEQSKAYMRSFMSYSEENTALLMDLFRHKVVHLSAPKPVVEFHGKSIAWRYRHCDPAVHLKLEPISPTSVDSFPGANLNADHEFGISIHHFAEDIKGSVTGPGGYLTQLENTVDLQVKFISAVYDFYDPRQ
jgi:hypothetical protein